MAASGTTWNDLINKLPNYLMETVSNSNLTDTIVLPLINNEYVKICEETGALFMHGLGYELGGVASSFDVSSNVDFGQANVIIDVILDTYRKLYFAGAGATRPELQMVRNRESLDSITGTDPSHYFYEYPTLYFAPAGASEDMFYLSAIGIGAECADVTDADNGPEFNLGLQSLGEKVLSLRTIAAYCRADNDIRAQFYETEAQRATYQLALRASQLHSYTAHMNFIRRAAR